METFNSLILLSLVLLLHPSTEAGVRHLGLGKAAADTNRIIDGDVISLDTDFKSIKLQLSDLKTLIQQQTGLIQGLVEKQNKMANENSKWLKRYKSTRRYLRNLNRTCQCRRHKLKSTRKARGYTVLNKLLQKITSNDSEKRHKYIGKEARELILPLHDHPDTGTSDVAGSGHDELKHSQATSNSSIISANSELLQNKTIKDSQTTSNASRLPDSIGYLDNKTNQDSQTTSNPSIISDSSGYLENETSQSSSIVAATPETPAHGESSKFIQKITSNVASEQRTLDLPLNDLPQTNTSDVRQSGHDKHKHSQATSNRSIISDNSEYLENKTSQNKSIVATTSETPTSTILTILNKFLQKTTSNDSEKREVILPMTDHPDNDTSAVTESEQDELKHSQTLNSSIISDSSRYLENETNKTSQNILENNTDQNSSIVATTPGQPTHDEFTQTPDLNRTIAESQDLMTPETSQDLTTNLYDFEVDLTSGMTYDNSPSISLVDKLTYGKSPRCGLQGVVMATFPSVKLDETQKTLMIDMWFDTPTGWVFNIGDSIANDGMSGDGSVQENDGEAEGFGTSFNVYGSDKHRETMDKLLYKADNSINQNMTVLVTDEAISWKSGSKDFQNLTNPALFALKGQSDSQGPSNYDIYIGMNRVIAGNYRSGSGLCKIAFKWL